MSNGVAIAVKNVSKDFELPHERKQSVKGLVIGMLKGGNRTVELQHALRNVSFEVKKGEFFGIVGRNGSGKSTLLKMLAGIYQPNKGSVTVQGTLVPFIELGVGFNPELTGRENVYLNGALLGFSKKQMDDQYNDIVAFAELEDFMDQKLKNYSSGMQVRLAFSLAIRAHSDILLVDEVLAVGDADFQRRCFEYFKALKSAKQTVIFVSHDMSAVQQYCDRALLIDDSRVVKIGKPSEIATMYSKLFTSQDNLTIKSKKGNVGPSGEERWGDGWATWTKVTATLSGEKGEGEPEFIDITAKGKAAHDIDYPIFGFSVKGPDFVQLAGTNTVRKNITVKPIKAGEDFAVHWRVPNVFNVGTHYIDCTIAHDQASNVSDRWPDAASFIMRRLESNPYPVYPMHMTFTFSPTKEGHKNEKAN